MKCVNSIVLCFFLTGACIFDASVVQAEQLQAVENNVGSLNDGVLTVASGITEISADMFKNIDAAAITKVILPEGLKTIRVSTFKDFDNLKEIYIPSSVEFIQSRMFGASNIFSSNLKDGLKISINKTQMPGLIKFATDNLKPDSVRKTKGLNISWEILDSSTGKKLCKTFKPTFDEWNKYKNSIGYWEDVVQTLELPIEVEEISTFDEVKPEQLKNAPVETVAVQEPVKTLKHTPERTSYYQEPIQHDFRSVLKNKVRSPERTNYYKEPEQLDFRHVLKKKRTNIQ